MTEETLTTAQADNATHLSKLAAVLGVDTTIQSTGDLIKSIAGQDSTDKAIVSTALLNVFQMAVQKLGNRQMMNHHDFMAFGMALAAIDSIVPTPPQPQQASGNGR